MTQNRHKVDTILNTCFGGNMSSDGRMLFCGSVQCVCVCVLFHEWFFFFMIRSSCSIGWPQTYYIAKTSLLFF